MLIDLMPDEPAELHCHWFMVTVDRCSGSCNTIDDPSGKICVPNKAGDLSVKRFKTITGINESINDINKTYFM